MAVDRKAMGKRLASLIPYRSQARYAQKWGMRPTLLNQILQGHVNLTPDNATRVCQCEGVTFDWIYLGTGPEPKAPGERTTTAGPAEPGQEPVKALTPVTLKKLLSDAVSQVREKPLPTVLVVAGEDVQKVMRDLGANAQQYVPIPYMDQKVAAGPPLEVVDERVKDFLLVHRRKIRRTTGYFGVQIDGDSMEPRYPSGSIVVVDSEQKDPSALIHKIVLAIHEGGGLVKWLSQDESHWILESENARYRPIYIKKEINPIVGRIVGGWVEER